MSPLRAAAGFTVVEVVAVLAITAIIAGVVAPRMWGNSEFDERFFFDDAISALRYSKKLAIATGCRAQIDISGGSYTVNLQNSCSGSTYTQAVVHPGTGAATYSNSAPSGVTFTSTVSPLIFDPLGRALNDSGSVTNATVTVGSRTISVVGESGFVHAP
jgi:MSHA pilin protein MshC